ncbi:MAG: hypothetical protein WBB07_28095 [Mycobacterium sp.]
MDKPIKKTFRTSLLTAGLTTVAAAALVGCGAGQVSQVATQEPATNGNAGTIEHIMLRNVHIEAIQATDALQPGTDVQLMFNATNQSPYINDRLMNITTDVGTVTLSGNTDVPANGLLEVGLPDGIDQLVALPEDADGAEAVVALTEPISNGLTYAFTFTFEEAGEKVIQVPISAGNAPRQASTGVGSGSGH